MGNLEDSIEFVKAERVANAKVADRPGEGKTPEELKRDLIEKELLENRKIIEALKTKEAKEALKSEFVEHETKPMKKGELPEMKVYTVKPVFHPGSKEEKAWNRKHEANEPARNPNAICPFCLEEKSTKGMNRHISAIHKVIGVTIQDLDDVENGLKSLKALVEEKSEYEGEAVVFGLSPEVSKKHFSDWEDLEESEIDDQEGAEIEEEINDQEEMKTIENNPGPPGDPELKNNPGEKKGFWHTGIWPWI